MSKRIPSLDGIRAIAIMMVLIIHSATPLGFAAWWVPDGVSIFFVLSGFLITSLMLREVDKTGTVNLKAFYLRRTYRILPPLYVYLAFATLLCMATGYSLDKWTVFDAAAFIRDYAGNGQRGGAWLTEHMWSLSVEEQFYLFYPALFLFVLRRWGRAPLAKVTLGLLMLAPIFRLGDHALHIFPHRDEFMFHTRIDALMTGCLLAISVGLPRFERAFARATRVAWIFPLYTLVLEPQIRYRTGYMYEHSIGMTVSSLCTGITILWCSRNAQTVAGRILNWRPLRVVGVLSYSIYIWQTLFLHDGSPAVRGALNHYPVRLAAIAIFALLSFYLVEKPFLKLRARANPLPTTAVPLEMLDEEPESHQQIA